MKIESYAAGTRTYHYSVQRIFTHIGRHTQPLLSPAIIIPHINTPFTHYSAANNMIIAYMCACEYNVCVSCRFPCCGATRDGCEINYGM